jgi:hypothetical protein
MREKVTFQTGGVVKEKKIIWTGDNPEKKEQIIESEWQKQIEDYLTIEDVSIITRRPFDEVLKRYKPQIVNDQPTFSESDINKAIEQIREFYNK